MGMFEKPPSAVKPPQRETPARFLKAAELNVKTLLGKIEVMGREHLDSIPPGARVIIVVSHISDLDIPLAITALGHDFDMTVAA